MLCYCDLVVLFIVSPKILDMDQLEGGWSDKYRDKWKLHRRSSRPCVV